MPDKSRRVHTPQGKKRKTRRRSSAIVAQRQAVAQAYKPVPQSKVSAPSTSTPPPMAAQTAARHPYIVSELRRIGILAGIVLATLVVLALVLS